MAGLLDPYGIYDGFNKPYQQPRVSLDDIVLSGVNPNMSPLGQISQLGMQDQTPQADIFQYQQPQPMAAGDRMGYEEVPQDFGGMDRMASIRGGLRNPAPQLPNFDSLSGMGLGSLTPQSFNQQGTLRQNFISELLDLMGA